MRIFTILCLLGVAFCLDTPLREVLKSPKDFQKLYKKFKSKQRLKYSGAEDRMRFKLFRKNAEAVASYNEKSKDAVFGLNFFSTMTPAEKKQMLGLNMTGHGPNPRAPPRASKKPPKKVLWTNVGAVTKVKDQGGCGSCWTFAAVGAIETRYKKMTGVLRSFAEQEYVDCTYEGIHDGCQGGWPAAAFEYSRLNGGRLAAGSVYEYEAAMAEKCQAERYRSAMVAAKIVSFGQVFRGEAPVIEALAEGAIAIAIEVTDYFQQYTHGIIKDTTCKKTANHAMTAVGYTGKFILVKNSWGDDWGDQGFVKFVRRYNNCGLFDYGTYPILTKTGKKDKKPDKGTGYRPIQNDSLAPEPEEEEDDDDDETKDCPKGTIRCPDGKCRHQHMC